MSGLGTAPSGKQAPDGLFTCPMYTCGDLARHTAPPASAPDSTAGGKRTLAQELETLVGGGGGCREALPPPFSLGGSSYQGP